MKRVLALVILLGLGILFPWACAENNPSSPVKAPFPPTNTPTGTQTPTTPTNTPTLAAGANTFTPTPTYSLPVPLFKNNYSTSAAPNGMLINGTILTVAESEVTSSGNIATMEGFIGAGTTILNIDNWPGYTAGGVANINNVLLTGAAPPTPNPTVPFLPTTIALQGPVGFVNPGGSGPGGWSAVLDQPPGGTAILYAGYYTSWQSAGVSDIRYMPYFGSSYGGAAFNNPKSMCADQAGPSGRIYVTDTGNNEVEEFSPYEGIFGQPPLPVHQWYGAQGVTVGGTGVTFSSAGVSFKSPCAVACDTASPPNVWVGDVGYTNSVIMEFTSGATTILESWQGIANCKVSGLAIDSGTGNVYVADSGNNMVEVYSSTGTLLTAFGDPGPAAAEPKPFKPSCIAFSGGYIYVGDTNNDYIDIFK